MAVPKGKVSKQRRNKRRSSVWKLATPGLVACTKCGALHLPHRMCPECGTCLLYTSDAADDLTRVDLGGRRIIKKNFFKQKTAYEITTRLVGSEMCIRDRYSCCSLRDLTRAPITCSSCSSRSVSYTHLTLPTILRV